MVFRSTTITNNHVYHPEAAWRRNTCLKIASISLVAGCPSDSREFCYEVATILASGLGYSIRMVLDEGRLRLLFTQTMYDVSVIRALAAGCK